MSNATACREPAATARFVRSSPAPSARRAATGSVRGRSAKLATHRLDSCVRHRHRLDRPVVLGSAHRMQREGPGGILHQGVEAFGQGACLEIRNQVDRPASRRFGQGGETGLQTARQAGEIQPRPAGRRFVEIGDASEAPIGQNNARLGRAGIEQRLGRVDRLGPRPPRAAWTARHPAPPPWPARSAGHRPARRRSASRAARTPAPAPPAGRGAAPAEPAATGCGGCAPAPRLRASA